MPGYLILTCVESAFKLSKYFVVNQGLYSII